MGGIVLHDGNIPEMRTGEGKTLTATMPVYLNALSGEGVHVVTVNEYLATRDSNEMGELYNFLGLSVGLNINSKSSDEKREAYNCDITYSTNNELDLTICVITWLFIAPNGSTSIKLCNCR